MAALSALADATLAAAYEIAVGELPAGHRAAAAGRGRDGQVRRRRAELRLRRGRHLRGRRRRRPDRRHHRSPTRLIQICGLVAWPVDAALRPEGSRGPLVRTLASHLAYYRRWARTWEFQALLKARPAAGDLALAPGVARPARPAGLARRRAARGGRGRPRHAPAGSSTTSRRRSWSARSSAGRAGCATSSSRCSCCNWCTAAATSRCGRPAPSRRCARWSPAATSAAPTARRCCAATASCAASSTGCSCRACAAPTPCPTEPAALRWLAAALGYTATPGRSAVEAFRAEWVTHATEVRRLHAKLLYRPLLEAVARVPADGLRLTPEAARHRLEILGFADPAGALRHLQALTGGVSPHRGDPAHPAAGAAQRVRRRAGAGPRACSTTGRSPTSSAAPPGTCGCCATRARWPGGWPGCSASSRYAADLLARDPEALRLLAEDAELRPAPARGAAATASPPPAARHADPVEAIRAVRALRRRELFRIACADVLSRAGSLAPRPAAGLRPSAWPTSPRSAPPSPTSPTPPWPPRCAPPGPPSRRRPGCGSPSSAWAGSAGTRSSYPSDADVLFVYDPPAGMPDERGQRRRARDRRGAAPAARHAGARPAARRRRRPAPGGPAGPAGAQPRRVRAVLRPLVEGVGGAGAAAGPVRLRRRRPGRASSRRWPTRCATRPAG